MTDTSPTDIDNIESLNVAITAWLDENSPARRPNINDIARLSGVSKKTVSRVINGSPQVRPKTRARIQHVITRVSFEPDIQARGLAFRHSFLIGMIYNNPNPQYVVNFQEGVLEGLRGTDFELAVHHCNRDAPDFIKQSMRFVERHRLYGVIMSPSVSEDDRLADWLRETKRPFLRVAGVQLDAQTPMIVSNDKQGGKLAARHLAGLGHKNIAVITGRTGFRSSLERLDGFISGLKESGQSLKANNIIEGEYTLESGFKAAQKILSRPDRPTAIFASNDEMAAGALRAIHIHGLRVPEDISVMGYDDFGICLATSPQLSTIHSPTREIGTLAAKKLLMSQSSGNYDMVSNVVPTLVVRESTAAPKTAK